MLKISRKIEYSLMALKYMVGKYPGALTTAKEVCDMFHTPFDMTSKVMQSLAQKGILKSEQGAHGGYLIQRDLDKVSLHELVEVIEGPLGIAKCLHQEDTGCELSPTCNIVSPVSRLNDRLRDFYRGLSVMEVVQPPLRRERVSEGNMVSP